MTTLAPTLHILIILPFHFNYDHSSVAHELFRIYFYLNHHFILHFLIILFFFHFDNVAFFLSSGDMKGEEHADEMRVPLRWSWHSVSMMKVPADQHEFFYTSLLLDARWWCWLGRTIDRRIVVFFPRFGLLASLMFCLLLASRKQSSSGL
jgi:hypothetical protein